MRARDAKKLGNRDEVKVRLSKTRDTTKWALGFVSGDPVVNDYGVFVNVQTQASGFLVVNVRHTDLE
jgi:hypothetical protein